MTTGEKIRNARKNAHLTQKALSELCGIAEPTLRRYEADKLHPKPQTLKKIAAALGMAWYELSDDAVFNFDRELIVSAIQKSSPTPPHVEIEQETPPALTKKDERDIEKILAAARSQLENQEGLMFDGDPASPEAIESILAAMELGLQAAKQRNKEKYTPKKYRQK